MADKTAADLAKQIGRELMLIDSVSELSGEDNETIQEMSEGYHETLPQFDVRVTWDHRAIPLQVFYPLARALAGIMAATFGEALPSKEIDDRLYALERAARAPRVEMLRPDFR
jgi:hypothetical protein